jgi:SAM-dependent methyltransferase
MPVTQRPLYHSFAWAYDLVVARPGGPAVAAIVDALASRGIVSGATVLDAGCGSGRYAHELARAGYRVTGVDRSPELIEVARERSGAARFEVADLRTWAAPEPFDAALCRGVLNDLISDEDRRGAVAGLRRALRPGGVLIADVRDWGASVEHYRANPEFKRRVETDRGAFEFRSETALEPATRILRVSERIAVGDAAEESDFAMRCWTREELEATLRGAGFADVDPAVLAPRRADRIVAVAVAG